MCLWVFKLEQNWPSYNADKMSAFDTVANFLLKHILLTWIFLHSLIYISPIIWLLCFHTFCWEFLTEKRAENLFLYPLRFSLRGLQIKLAKDQFTGGKANSFIFCFACMGAPQKRSENPKKQLDLEASIPFLKKGIK